MKMNMYQDKTWPNKNNLNHIKKIQIVQKDIKGSQTLEQLPKEETESDQKTISNYKTAEDTNEQHTNII